MFFRPYPTNIFVAPQKPLTAQCSSKLKNSAVSHDKFYVTLVIGILCKFFAFYFFAKKILNSLQKKQINAKENFTYKNHLKFSKFCSSELLFQFLE